jgi:hypothetical protein
MKTSRANIYPLLPIALASALLIARAAPPVPKPIPSPRPQTYGTMVFVSSNLTNAYEAYTNLLAVSTNNLVTITTNNWTSTNKFIYTVCIEFRH